MAITRAKATTLLNATEMGLYDDSRANALRGHTEAKLARLVTRARTARDRARDLEKRQRLASRKSTGSKSGRIGQANARTGEKAELLADILTRLETQHRATAKAEKAAARVKPVAKKPVAKKAAKAASARTAAGATSRGAKKVATKTASAKTSPAKKAAAGKVKKSAASDTPSKAMKPAAKGANKAVAGSAGGKPGAKTSRRAVAGEAAGEGASKTRSAKKWAAGSSVSMDDAAKPRTKRSITPKRALENTRKLLAQQSEQAAQPKSWDGLGTPGTAQATPGYQSPQARSKALAHHAGETRQASINGSISTRDRKNQGKRDHRSDPD